MQCGLALRWPWGRHCQKVVSGAAAVGQHAGQDQLAPLPHGRSWGLWFTNGKGALVKAKTTKSVMEDFPRKLFGKDLLNKAKSVHKMVMQKWRLDRDWL